MNLAALATIVGPPALLIALLPVIWGKMVTGLDMALLAGFYSATVLGLTVGFHRLFTHRSFKCVRWMEAGLAILGCMAAQGPIVFWVGTHRRHHIKSDTEEDPHSPHVFGNGFRAACRGWWHAHVGWMFSADLSGLKPHVRDLRRDPIIVWCDKLYLVWIVAGLVVPAIIGGITGGGWLSAFRGLVWGGLVRIVLVHHVTWSINSICHMVGSAPYATGDHSRNNLLCALLSFGEGWHNNHHAAPASARHGFSARQPDVAWWFIRACEWLGLVWSVRRPDFGLLQEKIQPNRTNQ